MDSDYLATGVRHSRRISIPGYHPTTYSFIHGFAFIFTTDSMTRVIPPVPRRLHLHSPTRLLFYLPVTLSSYRREGSSYGHSPSEPSSWRRVEEGAWHSQPLMQFSQLSLACPLSYLIPSLPSPSTWPGRRCPQTCGLHFPGGGGLYLLPQPVTTHSLCAIQTFWYHFKYISAFA